VARPGRYAQQTRTALSKPYLLATCAAALGSHSNRAGANVLAWEPTDRRDEPRQRRGWAGPQKSISHERPSTVAERAAAPGKGIKPPPAARRGRARGSEHSERQRRPRSRAYRLRTDNWTPPPRTRDRHTVRAGATARQPQPKHGRRDHSAVGRSVTAPAVDGGTRCALGTRWATEAAQARPKAA